MKKVLGSWSGMRKYLEQEMLAPELQGRVRYNCTRYVGMDNCHIFEIYVDGRKIKQFSWETVNSYFINNGFTKIRPSGIKEYWKEFWTLLDTVPESERWEYTDEEFCTALEIYRSQQIGSSLGSPNPLVRMFAILDRRVGKRTLAKLEGTAGAQPAWLQFFYQLRLDAGRPLEGETSPSASKEQNPPAPKRTEGGGVSQEPL